MSQAGVDAALARLDVDSWNGYLDDLRAYERRVVGSRNESENASVLGLPIDPDEDFTSIGGEFRRSDPGYPLGPGFPSGNPLRSDGETHREAWARLVRDDPCSYCGRRGGTVDHIEPRRGPNAAAPRMCETWLNYAGACASCNGSKDGEKLLLWLARVVRPQSKTPAKDRRIERERLVA